MSDTGLLTELKQAAPELKGRLTAGVVLADVTWFRAGGPAEVMFSPADEADLAYFLRRAPKEVPVTVIGLGSNLLVRDGGVRGVVIRLGKGFSEIEALGEARMRCGTAAPDQRLAKAAADAGVAKLAFYRGIPGSIGGALRMNAGAHGTETKDILQSCRAVDRAGNLHELSLADMGFTYRHCEAPDDFIFTSATYQGVPGETAKILAEMEEVAQYREDKQPVKARTGGSTFKNPPGASAWRVIDAAGLRGFRVGDAVVSEKHCNFLINEDKASGEDIERLGETVRARVKAHSGTQLHWEIIRLGEPLGRPPDGRSAGDMKAHVRPSFRHPRTARALRLAAAFGDPAQEVARSASGF